MPVPRSRQEASHKKIHSLWNRPESLFPEADKKPPTKKLTLCGTGRKACSQKPTRNLPQENSLCVEQAGKPVPRSPPETTHKKTHSLWNRHLACL
ncbi:hypothetical protein [Microcoleus sp. B7-D4]|uniref:hypothetical protein n=1 Tax=Microcoleus sp. B7-D4 TaxID=2818696 RepID=UPI002FD35A35